MGFYVVRISELATGKDAEKFRPSPARNAFELCFRPRDVESFSPDFREQIAAVFARTAFRVRKEILGTAAQCQVDCRHVDELSRDLELCRRVGRMRIESGRGRSCDFAVGHEAGGAPGALSELEQCGGWKEILGTAAQCQVDCRHVDELSRDLEL